MNKCQHLDAVIASLDGQNDSVEQVDVITCTHCQAQTAGIQSAVAALQSLRMIAPDPQFSEQVNEKIQQRAGSPKWWKPAVALAVAAIVVAIFPLVTTDDTFFERGGSRIDWNRQVGIDFYAQHRGQQSRRLEKGAALYAEEGIAAVVHSRALKELWCAVIASDALGQMHWLYPEVSDGHESLGVLRIEPGKRDYPLPDAVELDVPLGAIRLIGIFSAAPLSRTSIEQAVAEGTITELPHVIRVATLEVERK